MTNVHLVAMVSDQMGVKVSESHATNFILILCGSYRTGKTELVAYNVTCTIKEVAKVL